MDRLKVKIELREINKQLIEIDLSNMNSSKYDEIILYTAISPFYITWSKNIIPMFLSSLNPELWIKHGSININYISSLYQKSLHSFSNIYSERNKTKPECNQQ